MSNQIEFIRTCRVCGNMFPPTKEYFPTTKGGGKTYLSHKCRVCTYEAAKVWRDSQTAECAEPDCEKKVQSRGYCIWHYKQHFERGVLPRIKYLPYRDGIITYNGMHQRLRMTRGHATLHQCSNCDKQATDWALKPTATERYIGETGPSLCEYSLNVDDYQPMCKPCHGAMDSKTRQERKAS